MNINIVVAASNLFALPAILKYARAGYTFEAVAMSAAAAASTCMHLSDRKHGLPGALFTKYTRALLNLDRAAAIGVTLIVLRRIILTSMYTEAAPAVLMFFIGGVSCLVSERVFVSAGTQAQFAVAHIIWHFLAYAAAATVI